MICRNFGLAAAGLVVWIIFVINNSKALAWTAFIILLPVALLGFTMLARWLPGFRASRVQVRAGAGTGPGAAAVTAPEQGFPVAIVLGHGLFATVTLVLVLLAALSAK